MRFGAIRVLLFGVRFSAAQARLARKFPCARCSYTFELHRLTQNVWTNLVSFEGVLSCSVQFPRTVDWCALYELWARWVALAAALGEVLTSKSAPCGL